MTRNELMSEIFQLKDELGITSDYIPEGYWDASIEDLIAQRDVLKKRLIDKN
jgi:hypothetical protein